jgi:3-mercaptopyruvate sulfurtransferase SseA
LYFTYLDIGIRPNNSEMIILYGNRDPMAAFRAALIMKWMGVKDIRILNGGYHAWISKKLTQETTTNQRLSIKNDQESLIKLYDDQVLNTQLVINYIVDQDYVLDLVKNQELFADQYQLVDVRSHDEYVGENRGFSDSEKEEEVIKKGRIPYAKWGGSGNESNRLQDYRNPDLTMRSGYEILRMWDDLGIDYKNKHLIFYCSNGWRSSEIMFYAELMGLYRISLYDGGWYDWSSNKKNYFQIGDNNDVLIAFDNSTSLETNSPFNLTTTTITTITTPPNTSTSILSENSTDSFNATISFNTTQQIQTTLKIENSTQTTLATTTKSAVNITKTTIGTTVTSRNSTLNNSSKRISSISYIINLICLFSLIFNLIF